MPARKTIKVKMTKKQIAHELWLTASNYEKVSENTIYRNCFQDKNDKSRWRYIGKAHNYSFVVE